MTFKRRLAGAFTGAAVLYLVRVLALYILARGFAQINLNESTYAYAPAWLRVVADNAGDIASIFGFATASCVLVLIQNSGRAFKAELWFTAALPVFAGAGFGLVKLLEAFDAVRTLPFLTHGSAFEWLKWLLMYLFLALEIRGTLTGLKPRWWLYALSAALEALFAFVAYGEFQPLLMINAFLCGWLALAVFYRRGTVVVEVLSCFGYTAGHRLLASYPDHGAFYMNGNPISGGAAGLNGSLLTSAILVALTAALSVFYAQRRHR